MGPKKVLLHAVLAARMWIATDVARALVVLPPLKKKSDIVVGLVPLGSWPEKKDRTVAELRRWLRKQQTCMRRFDTLCIPVVWGNHYTEPGPFETK